MKKILEFQLTKILFNYTDCTLIDTVLGRDENAYNPKHPKNKLPV